MSNVDEEHRASIAPGELAQRVAARDWVRPSTPEDAPAIVELMRSAGLEPHSDPRHLHWKYWQERSDWSEPRSFVMTDGRKLLAHLAVVPGAFRFGDTRARVTHMIDWAARRDAAGAGIRLAKHVARMSDFALATGGSDHTRKIFPMIGYVECGRISGYARTLSPARYSAQAHSITLETHSRAWRAASSGRSRRRGRIRRAGRRAGSRRTRSSG